MAHDVDIIMTTKKASSMPDEAFVENGEPAGAAKKALSMTDRAFLGIADGLWGYGWALTMASAAQLMQASV